MKGSIIVAAAAALFVGGIGVGIAGKKIMTTQSSMYVGQAPAAAAGALLAAADAQTEGGSYERIGVGRVLYLGGHKARGQAMFDAVLSAKPTAGDVFRIARVHAEAGEWTKAKPLFERFIAMNDYDEKELAEIGAHHMLNGDRTAAEALFAKSIEKDPRNTWATMRMAGAYLGVRPQP